jgi:hypothetical protein
MLTPGNEWATLTSGNEWATLTSGNEWATLTSGNEWALSPQVTSGLLSPQVTSGLLSPQAMLRRKCPILPKSAIYRLLSSPKFFRSIPFSSKSLYHFLAGAHTIF